MSRWCVGIDPALDLSGLAVLQWPTGSRFPTVARTVSIRTKPAAPMADRLAQIAACVQDELTTVSTAAVGQGVQDVCIAVEVPDYWGTHQKILRNGRTANVGREQLASYAQALGVVRATVAAFMRYAAPTWRTLELPATKDGKAARHAQFAQYTHWGKNEDERDAIVIGCLGLFQCAPIAEIAVASARPSTAKR